MRCALLALSLIVAIAGTIAVIGYREARAVPIVRQASFALPGWPDDVPPLRVALVADVHLGNAATDAARLRRIMRQLAMSRPDLVLLAGDFVAGHEPGAAARHVDDLASAVSQLRPPLGVLATLGNHDYWTGPTPVRTALGRAGVLTIDNAVVKRGPLVIAGIGDAFTRHDRIAATMSHAERYAGRWWS